MRMVLDCDPGYDDAIAIACAVAHAELVGVAAVAGNRGVDETTANARVACREFGYAGDLARGAAGPLVQGPPPAAPMAPLSVHAGPGDGSPGPRLRDDVDGAGLVIEKSSAPLWLVTTGPLTDAALALRRDPGLAGRLAGISILGGSASIGNVTAAAEFNVWADPEAAHVVLSCGAPIRLCGLDVTHEVLVHREFAAAIAALGAPCARFAARLLEVYIDTYPDAFVGQPRAPLHDPCAVLAVTHPALFEWRPVAAAVELHGGLTRGMTVLDRRDRPDGEPNVELAVSCDRQGVLAAIRAAIELAAARMATRADQSSEPAPRRWK